MAPYNIQKKVMDIVPALFKSKNSRNSLLKISNTSHNSSKQSLKRSLSKDKMLKKRGSKDHLATQVDSNSSTRLKTTQAMSGEHDGPLNSTLPKQI